MGMNRKQWLTLASLCGLLVSVYADAAAVTPAYDLKTLAQVEALYGLSEEAAISRLDNEYTASVRARSIEEDGLPSYAGSWFDSTTQSLHVAVSDQADFGAVERIGATPVLVAHSLTELEAAQNDVVSRFSVGFGGGNVLKSYVDVQANAVVIGISAGAVEEATAFLSSLIGINVPVHLQSVAPAGFSSNLHGADGTQNASWVTQYGGGPYPCSVGASAEEVTGSGYVVGYATAGHCGYAGNSIDSGAGASLGTVVQSTAAIVNGRKTFSNNQDGAWVSTVAGWTPQPQINGYTDGIRSVSGTWAGMLVAPVGTTACRYGEASQGPHCAPISVLNESITIYYGSIGYPFKGMIEVDGICTEDGDSGGPLVTPANQVQGTVTGGTPNSCPDSSGDKVYFQPIATTLNTASSYLHNSVAMLTSYGRSAPTIFNYLCPDSANSDPGLGIYACDIGSYDSQGKTDISWTASTGDSATVEQIFFRCHPSDPPVNLTLTVSNPYGTITKHTTFACP
jgi:streptogrisin C